MEEADLTRTDVADFECGPNFWQQEITQFFKDKALRGHKPPKQRTYLYCDDGGAGELIGFLNIVAKLQKSSASDEDPLQLLHITNLGIDATHQGKGYGTAMLDEILRQAKTEGFAIVDLYVHESNEPAIRLYQKKAFRFQEGVEHIQEGQRYLKMVRVIQ